MTTDELKKRIASLFHAARAEGPIPKWADGITDAQEVMDLIEPIQRIERMKFLLFLQEKYLVKSGNQYRITDADIAEIKAGIKIRPEWEHIPMYQAVMAGERWGLA